MVNKSKAERADRRMSRREKIAAQRDPRFSSSGDVVTSFTAPKLVPKNENQKAAMGMLDSGKTCVFLVGSAGTGKSLLAANRAAHLLKSKSIDKVFLVRPNVSTGKSAGSLPGTLEEKMGPFFAQTISHLEKFLGKGFVTYCLEKKKIEIRAIEYMRGQSLEDCFVIVEESQGLTSELFEMVLTRIGDNCQIVFTGDQRQSDIKGINGLEHTIHMIDKVLDEEPEFMSDESLDVLDSDVGIVRFTPDDVVRSGLTKAFVQMYFNS